MADHNGHGPTGPSEEQMKNAIAAGYEVEDVSLSVLLRWGFGLGVFLLATSAFALILFAALQRPPFGPPALGQTFLRRENIVPPNGTPILQDNPAGDPRPDNNPRKGIDNIREFRREEEIRMNEYATQDGDIHIPLNRAMEIAVRELEVQKPGETPTGVTPTPEMKIHAPAAGAESAPAGGMSGTGASSSTPGAAPPSGAGAERGGTPLKGPGAEPGAAPTTGTTTEPGTTTTGPPGLPPRMVVPGSKPLNGAPQSSTPGR